MSRDDDDLDDLITSRVGRKSMNLAEPKDGRRQTLKPKEDGKPTNKIVEPEDHHSKPLIRKVSQMLRNDKNMEKYYEPRAVSIGPLHHGRDNKISLGEGHKIKLAKLFIAENGLDEYSLRNKIKAKIATLKRCYGEEDIKRVNLKDDDLSRVFLFDGFALLHYICYASSGKLDDLKIGMDMEAFSHQDLFLLENQLPFEVLDEIMKSKADGGADIRNSIEKFIDKTVRDIRGASFRSETASPTSPLQPPQPAHLLQLLWNRLVGDHDVKEKAKSGKPETIESGQKVGRVNELKAAGIKLKSGREGTSLRDISLFAGTLTLPSLVLDDSTAPKLLNLIAFEMCPDFLNDYQVTSYIFFLHSLIGQPNDVKELQKARVLHNALGSDEEVARLFKAIRTDLDLIPEAFSEVKDLIQKHCEKKSKTSWRAYAFPGAFFALAVAIAVLVMSFSTRLGAPLN